MEEGRLRRERLTIFFSRTVETRAPVARQSVAAEYFDTLAQKESLSLLARVSIRQPGQSGEPARFLKQELKSREKPV